MVARRVDVSHLAILLIVYHPGASRIAHPLAPNPFNTTKRERETEMHFIYPHFFVGTLLPCWADWNGPSRVIEFFFYGSIMSDKIFSTWHYGHSCGTRNRQVAGHQSMYPRKDKVSGITCSDR